MAGSFQGKRREPAVAGAGLSALFCLSGYAGLYDCLLSTDYSYNFPAHIVGPYPFGNDSPDRLGNRNGEIPIGMYRYMFGVVAN